MKTIRTEDAIGHILCHDLTQIIPGEKKDAIFRKGHIVREEDIPLLLSIGKEQLYVWENQEGFLHENEAAKQLYSICAGEYMQPSEVKEGKIEFISEIDGLLKINIPILDKINTIDQLIIATRHSNFPVKKGDKIAGTRVIPLAIHESKLVAAKEASQGQPVLKILPFCKKNVGIVITGSEVARGRINDSFGSVVTQKLNKYDVTLFEPKITDDTPEKIITAILDFINAGADMVVCTGGMSVDPDDKTPAAIKNTGANIISYGTPVLPGAMLLVSYYKNNIPILGLPGCVMYGRTTVFDLILPRIMANDPITKTELAQLGHGGLCLNCAECYFPNCGFGK